VSLTKGNDITEKAQVLTTICNCLSFFKDVEAIFRIFVGLGSILSTSAGSEFEELVKIVRQSENTLRILQTCSESSEASAQSKLFIVSKEIINLIV
jgi:hypothetical protein